MAHRFHLVDELPYQARIAGRLLLLGTFGSKPCKKEGCHLAEALPEPFELRAIQGGLIGLGPPVQDLVEAARTE